MKKLLILSFLALGYQSASAQLVTERFGTGADAFTMDFVTIGNPNNAADTTGSPNPAGSVGYIYNIAKYEVSREQIDKANSAGSLGITMSDMSGLGGNGPNRPATGISWGEAAMYVNELNTSTGNTAAYKFVGGTFQLWSPTDAGYNASNMYRNSLAKYVIASSDEWYKAAFGRPDGLWNKYTTGSNITPDPIQSGLTGAVYLQNVFVGPSNVYEAGSLSSWGTMAQGGNIWEWVETAWDGVNDDPNEYRQNRGGSWNDYAIFMDSSPLDSLHNYPAAPGDDHTGFQYVPESYSHLGNGFRIAMVPEPTSLSLLALGGVLVALRRRR